MSERKMCYVGLKACGCAVAAAVDLPDLAKDNAKCIAKWMRDGLTIERKPVEWVRENLMRCTHAKRSGELDLVGVQEAK
jgi:hypothetical protein